MFGVLGFSRRLVGVFGVLGLRAWAEGFVGFRKVRRFREKARMKCWRAYRGIVGVSFVHVGLFCWRLAQTL